MIAKLGKMAGHARDVQVLLEKLMDEGDDQALEEYLLLNSNLPSPRGNIELATAFGDVVGDFAWQGQAVQQLWAQCVHMTGISVEEAPVNDPREFLPFCGAVGLGAIGSASAGFYDPALAALRPLARDRRWRMREAVCFALQRLMVAHRKQTLSALTEWVSGGDLLEMRAAAATVAEPAILHDADSAPSALQLHREIFDQLPGLEERRSEAFKVLRKGLGYTLSVVVQALPDEGFSLMAELLQRGDRDVDWIVSQNLKKNRLAKYHPERVKALEPLL
jgi:hypothetical protein